MAAVANGKCASYTRAERKGNVATGGSEPLGSVKMTISGFSFLKNCRKSENWYRFKRNHESDATDFTAE